MIRRLLIWSLIALCVGVIATPAMAVKHTGLTNKTVYHYDPDYRRPGDIRVVGVYYIGWNIVVVSERTIDAKCSERITTYYAFFVKTNETLETVCRP